MKRLEEQLVEVSKPSVDLPLHRAQLRRALLHSSLSDLGSFTRFSMSFTKLLPAGLALVLIFGLAFTFRSGETSDYVAPTASAQDLVDDVLANLQGLSDAQMEVIKDRLKVGAVEDVFALLEAARMAPDLKYASVQSLSCEKVEADSQEPIQGAEAFDLMMVEDIELDSPNCSALLFTQELAMDSFTTPLGRNFRMVHVFDSSLSVFDDLTYLNFISSDGVVNILGVDKDFIPVEAFSFGDGALPGGASFTIFGVVGIDGNATGSKPEASEALQSFVLGAGNSVTMQEGGIIKVDESTGCSSWTSDDGLMGGGGC